MARAQAHLASGRFAEAIGAFRAALAIDGSALPARLGLAEAMTARGDRTEAIAGLLEAAERFAEVGQHAHALSLYGKALALDPQRIALHLDVAVIERALGRHAEAIARVEGLAERYMDEGRTNEAAELLRFAASWEEELEPRAMTATSETVVCATVLIRPDGTLFVSSAAPTTRRAGARRVAPPPVRTASEPARRVAPPPVRTTSEPARRVAPPPVRATSEPARRVAPPPVRTTSEPARRGPPPVRTTSEEVDPDMVTRVASRPHAASRPPARPPARASAMPVVPPARAPASASALVERLRRRAGLELEERAVPRSITTRGTESITVRREQEEVTHRFHRPRRLDRVTVI